MPTARIWLRDAKYEHHRTPANPVVPVFGTGCRGFESLQVRHLIQRDFRRQRAIFWVIVDAQGRVRSPFTAESASFLHPLCGFRCSTAHPWALGGRDNSPAFQRPSRSVTQTTAHYAGSPAVVLHGLPGSPEPAINIVLAHGNHVYLIIVPGRQIAADQRAALGSLRFIPRTGRFPGDVSG
jgi:hypothetical protein